MTDGTITQERPARGELLTLDVETLAYGGKGVARRDGYVVFVSGALPGDRVTAEVTKAKRGYAEAQAKEIVRSSPDRVPPRCDHGGEPCPGAPWQGLAYEEQLRHKQLQVDDALVRLGGLQDFHLESIEPAIEQWRYRNKLEYSFGERDGELVLGFHARGRWDLIVDAEDCQLASERNNARRNELRDWARSAGLPAWDRRAQQGVLRNLVIREGRRTGQLQSRLVTSATEIPRPPVDLHTIVEGPGSTTNGPTGAIGAEYLEEELCGLRFRISHRAFFQTNTEMAERLYGIAAELAGLTGSERVFDLFCGIGTLGLTLARQAGEVWGIEHRPRGDRRRRGERPAQRDRERALPCRRCPQGDPPPARGGRPPRRRRRRPATRRALEEDRPPADRVRGAADRLRLLQPDHARAQRGPARGGRL